MRIAFGHGSRVFSGRATRLAAGSVLMLLAPILAACGGNGGSGGTAPNLPAGGTTTSVPSAASSSTWSSPTPVSHGAPLVALACPTTSFCLALDDQGRAYRFNGSTWLPVGNSGLGNAGSPSLSCTGPTFCVAMAQGGNQVVLWSGTGFTAPTTLSTQGLGAVGCASPTFCVAIDGEGNARYFDGSTWSGRANDWGSVAAISCPTAGFCASVGGGMSIWNGSSWSEPQPYGLVSGQTGVSCPTVTFCQVVDGTGQVGTWNGSSWGSAVNVPMSGTSATEGTPGTGNGVVLNGVSCTSAAFCVAVGSMGYAYTWNGSAWSSQQVDSLVALSAVSCVVPTTASSPMPAVVRCVAVDHQGDAVIRG